MEGLLGVFGLVVFFGVAWVLSKISDGAMIGLNRGVFSRGEYKESEHVRHGFTAVAASTPAQIARDLTNYVAAVDAPLGFQAVLYEADRADDHITYVYGGKGKAQFVTIVTFAPQGDKTIVRFAVARWHEEDGMTVDLDRLKALRMQVEAAVRAADPDATFTDGITVAAESMEGQET